MYSIKYICIILYICFYRASLVLTLYMKNLKKKEALKRNKQTHLGYGIC